MVARGVGRELAASVAAHRDILCRIQHPCGMIIPCFSPVVNTFFCGFGDSRNFRDIVTKTTGYSGVVWLKGRPGCRRQGANHAPGGGLPGWLPADLAAAVPSGGRAFFVARLPCLWFALSPPSPRPPSPPGKGEIFCFLMQGASPLAFPALDRLRHLQNLLSKYQAGACPRRHLLSPPRGRGPSQTPKFLSPGPPSPWLAALLTSAAS